MPRPKPNVYLSPSLFVEMGHLAIHLSISRVETVELACRKFLEMSRELNGTELLTTPMKQPQPIQLRKSSLRSTIGKGESKDELENFAKKLLWEAAKLK